MPECRLCGKNGEDLALLSANHKDMGRIMVCEGYWKELWMHMHACMHRNVYMNQHSYE